MQDFGVLLLTLLTLSMAVIEKSSRQSEMSTMDNGMSPILPSMGNREPVTPRVHRRIRWVLQRRPQERIWRCACP
jgi:hypothetical protein